MSYANVPLAPSGFLTSHLYLLRGWFIRGLPYLDLTTPRATYVMRSILAAGTALVVAYMLDLLGDDDHVGFGSDFDGISHPPCNIQGVQDFVPLVEFLTKKFSDTTIEKITHQNCLNYLQRVL